MSINKFFSITAKDKNTQARCGVMHTEHGDVETPVFIPVGTQATVKTLDVADLHEISSQIILGNAYHLHLRPGENALEKAGGIHGFMGWHRAVLTDSGGFQIMSLGKGLRGSSSLAKIDDDGVTFRSHIDGSLHRFTPEEAIRIQQKIGADIIMAFDQCTRDSVSAFEAQHAMARTHVWAERCMAFHKKNTQALFGIVQGGPYEILRKESAQFISSLPFDGIAIGGESIGYYMSATEKIIDWVMPLIPENKPHYTMGVGASPLDLLRVVRQGIDMFDCVAPTRMARNGGIFCKKAGKTNKHRIAIKNAQFAGDARSLCAWCTCQYCQGTNDAPPITRQYLHHLFRAEEILGLRIASYHNVSFLMQLMKETREAIATGCFQELFNEWSQ